MFPEEHAVKPESRAHPKATLPTTSIVILPKSLQMLVSLPCRAYPARLVPRCSALRLMSSVDMPRL